VNILQAVIWVLEGDYDQRAKEAALIVLSNICAGDVSKAFIIGNEDILRKITNYMVVSDCKQQTAAVMCICNLVSNEDVGYEERQAKLREMGVYKLLQSLQNTADPELYEKAKMAIQQFQ